MNNDNGRSYYSIGLDNKQLRVDAEEASKILRSIDVEAEKHSNSVRELLKNIPTVRIDVVSNADITLENIDAMYADIDRVVEANKFAVIELEKEYQRLAVSVEEAFQKGDDKQYNELVQYKNEVKRVIAVRKNVIKEAANTADALFKEEQRLKGIAVEAEKVANKHATLRTQLRQVKEQLAEMEVAGERGSEAYVRLQREAARLTDTWADAQTQATILAHDQKGLQGIISGLQGVTGAAAIAQGAIGLFGGENERLQEIMLRVQSLMAITMGLQQVQQTLNKDSAFSLVTLNSLKEMWNKITGRSIKSLEDENASIAINTGSQKANTTATVADTVAKKANNTSTSKGILAQGKHSTATKVATTATVAQTVATKAASMAMRGLKAALISTGIGAFIVLVGELVGWLSSLFEKTKAANKLFQEQQDLLTRGRETYAKASMEIANYNERLSVFNGTQEEEGKIVKELNKKYGEQMGYYNSIKEWKQVLIDKGEAYCDVLLREANAQELLNQYTKSYAHLKEVEAKAERGDYDSWFNTKLGNDILRAKKIQEATQKMNQIREDFRSEMANIKLLKDRFDLNPHEDPSVLHPQGRDNLSFDPQKAIEQSRKALTDYTEARKKYIKDANDEIDNLIIEGQEQGLERDLSEIRRGTRKKLEAWNDQLEQLAEVRKEVAKAQYMNAKGATEAGWENSEDGKKTIKDWIDVIRKESPSVINEFNNVWATIAENGEKEITQTQKRYNDALINEFGTMAQKEEKLTREWSERMASIPTQFLAQATRQMEQEFAKLNSDKFKSAMDWETIFGDISKQSLASLKFTLGKVKEYFEQNKAAMSTQDIKDYQEAIMNMENEIADRNPFAALHQSIRDIEGAKKELVEAFAAMKISQEELTFAMQEQNEAQREYNEILAQVERGELVENCEEQTEALERLRKAKIAVSTATSKNITTEQKAIRAQNQIASSYKRLGSSLSNINGIINDVGEKAENLAYIFSEDVANSIAKAIDFAYEIMEVTSDVMNVIGDVGKDVVSGIENTVEAASSGAEAAASSATTSIAMVEKASVILTVISAVIQAATAIAKLYNDDDNIEKYIEGLQRRIDQLQWEINNSDIMLLQKKYGSVFDEVQRMFSEYAKGLEDIQLATRHFGANTGRWFAIAADGGEAYNKMVEDIAESYADIEYAASKALGTEKYTNATGQLKKYAEQVVLLREQINAEESKKHTDYGEIERIKNKMEEVRAQALEYVNSIIEDIVGRTAENLASELGNAFFEAAKAGENAMEMWHQKVDEIIADIIKRMLITQYLEPEIGKAFDKMKAEWNRWRKLTELGSKDIQNPFTDDGKMKEFKDDLNEAGNMFNEIYNGLSESLKDIISLGEDEERRASERGIATATQDSIDELNGRATAIQGHTYSINEYTKELASTTNLILQSVVNIESETYGLGDRMESVEASVREVRNTINDISLRGIKIQ